MGTKLLSNLIIVVMVEM